MTDAAAINRGGAAIIPRFSTQRASMQVQQQQQTHQHVQSGGPGMMTFEFYDPHNPHGRTCDQTNQSSFFSYQEHFLKVSSKSDERNSRYVETS